MKVGHKMKLQGIMKRKFGFRIDQRVQNEIDFCCQQLNTIPAKLMRSLIHNCYLTQRELEEKRIRHERGISDDAL